MLCVVPNVWGTLLGHGLQFVQGRHISNLMKEQDCICAWTSKIAVLPAIELNPSCLGQAHLNVSGTGTGYENMEPGCILAILSVPSIIHPFKVWMPCLARLFKRFHTAGTDWHQDLSLSWRVSEDPLKRP